MIIILELIKWVVKYRNLLRYFLLELSLLKYFSLEQLPCLNIITRNHCIVNNISNIFTIFIMSWDRIPNITFFAHLMFCLNFRLTQTFIAIPPLIWLTIYTIKLTSRFAWYMFYLCLWFIYSYIDVTNLQTWILFFIWQTYPFR